MFKIKNAIILAAGRGTRMKDMTDDVPKPLLKINDISIIENIIIHLQKITKNITIVTGYLSYQFDYLQEKYNIKLINNFEWENNNNVTSIEKVKHQLSNTLIVNGDIIINHKKPFKKFYKKPCFYVEKNNNLSEWLAIFDAKNNIIDFNRNPIKQLGYYQREVTVINKKLSRAIKNEIVYFDLKEYFEFLVLKCSKKYKIPIKKFEISPDSIFDLDNKEDYLNYKNKNENF